MIMKKEYSKPQTEAIELKAMAPLASSEIPVDGSGPSRIVGDRDLFEDYEW